MLLDANPLHGCPGGLYRPTPQGYNGKTGWVRVPVVCLSGAVFSTGFWGPTTGGSHRLAWYTGTSALVRRGWVMLVADYCSRASNDAGLVMGSWHLVNGAWAPGEGPADSWGPTPIQPDWWRSRRLLDSR